MRAEYAPHLLFYCKDDKVILIKKGRNIMYRNDFLRLLFLTDIAAGSRAVVNGIRGNDNDSSSTSSSSSSSSSGCSIL